MTAQRPRLPWKYRKAQHDRTEAARRLFHEFNDLYFGGRLRDIKIRFSRSKYLFMRGSNGTVLAGKFREWTPGYIEIKPNRAAAGGGERREARKNFGHDRRFFYR